MKKIYLFAIAVSLSYYGFSQQRGVQSLAQMNQVNGSHQFKVLTPTDTLYWTNPATPVIYSAQGGGYVAGNNGYGDLAKMQQFVVSSPYLVEGTVLWFGGKKPGGGTGVPTSKVVCNIYNMDGTGASTAGTNVAAPGTVAKSADVLWDDIDTSSAGAAGFVYVTFSTPFLASVDYAVGVDFSQLAAGDTTGLVSNTNGEGLNAELTWEKWDDNSLHTLLDAWPLDIDFAIFPIINTVAGINDKNAVNGIKLFQNQPNPFNGESMINYGLDNNAKDVKVIVFDVHGKLVKIFEQGTQNAGNYSLKLNSSDFSEGIYTFAIQADSHRLAKRMTVVH